MRAYRTAFTLIELLVVMVIIAILITIGVKGMMGRASHRALTGSVDTFASDMRWARTQAEKTGNTVYVAFLFDFDPNEVEPPLGLAPSVGVWDSGYAIPPDNPGVSRASKGYIIVEERPRFHQGSPLPPIRQLASNSGGYLYSEWGEPGADGSIDGIEYATPVGVPYTYRDYLGDVWMAESYPGNYSYPLEPIYPRNDTLTNDLLEDIVIRLDYNINRDSIPEIFYPFRLLGPDGTNYQSNDNPGGYMGNLYKTNVAAMDAGTLAFFRQDRVQGSKMFCTGSMDVIKLYNADYGDELKSLPSGFVVENQTFDHGIDHPRMNDQVVDYIEILKRELPDHAILMNPHSPKFQVKWDSSTGDEEWQDFQFLQFLIAIDPQGRTSLREWGFSPEYFPPSSPQDNSALVHGMVVVREPLPTLRTVYMVTDDVVEYIGTSAIIAPNAAANLDSNGRAYTFWPIVGKYYVDAYVPNDRKYFIPDYDDRLNVSSNLSGFGTYISSYGFRRNFLTPYVP